MEAMTIERQMEAISIVEKFSGVELRVTSVTATQTLEIGGSSNLSSLEIGELTRKGFHYSIYADTETREWPTLMIHIF